MSVVRWGRAQALRTHDPLELDELGEADLLVLEGVGDEDRSQLDWCRRAPCVVVACTPDGQGRCSAVDVSLTGSDVDRYLEPVTLAVSAQPAAARALVDVLRVVERLDVPGGLVVESLAYSVLLASPEFACWLKSRRTRTPHAFEGAAVRVERNGSVLTVSLARPANRNAFGAEMRDALLDALSVADIDDQIDEIVLQGDGPVFCSGGELSEFGSATDVMRAHEVRTLRSVGAVIARLAPKVTVRLDGRCVGAGVELAAFAGRVLAAPGTSVLLPEVAMGLIPGAGGTVSLTRRIGRQRTALLALLGEPVDTDDPLVEGLVDGAW